jgi:hypothetical protein
MANSPAERIAERAAEAPPGAWVLEVLVHARQVADVHT